MESKVDECTPYIYHNGKYAVIKQRANPVSSGHIPSCLLLTFAAEGSHISRLLNSLLQCFSVRAGDLRLPSKFVVGAGFDVTQCSARNRPQMF